MNCVFSSGKNKKILQKYYSPTPAQTQGAERTGRREDCAGLLPRPARGTVIQGTRIVAQALLAIPDAPPACFAHWARQASVLYIPLDSHTPSERWGGISIPKDRRLILCEHGRTQFAAVVVCKIADSSKILFCAKLGLSINGFACESTVQKKACCLQFAGGKPFWLREENY